MEKQKMNVLEIAIGLYLMLQMECVQNWLLHVLIGTTKLYVNHSQLKTKIKMMWLYNAISDWQQPLIKVKVFVNKCSQVVMITMIKVPIVRELMDKLNYSITWIASMKNMMELRVFVKKIQLNVKISQYKNAWFLQDSMARNVVQLRQVVYLLLNALPSIMIRWIVIKLLTL